MKFCSIGTVKTQRELRESQTYMYLFGEESQKPSGFEDVLDILPDARSISYGATESSLSCSPIAGLSGSRLYLTYLSVANPPMEVNSVITYPPSFVKTPIDIFKKFCVYANAWEVSGNFSSSNQGILNKTEIGFGKFDYSPYRHQLNGKVSAQMVLMPNRNTVTENKSIQSVSTTLAQKFLDSVNVYNGDRWTYTLAHNSYRSELKINMNGSCAAKSVALAETVSGTNNVEVTSNSLPGIFLIRTSHQRTYTPTLTWRPEYTYLLPEFCTPAYTVVDKLTLLPFIQAEGEDEEVNFSFGISASRRQDHIRVVLHEFGSDLIQTGSKVPNTLPSVNVQTIDDRDFNPVLSI